MRSYSWLAIPFIASAVMTGQETPKPVFKDAIRAIDKVLDDWHQAAAQADEERFFGHLAPEAIFIGTDQKERWMKEEFRKTAHPWFQNHATWTFRPYQRSIEFSASGDVAWFDELIDMLGAGTARGSGVLIKTDSDWLIAQYSLSIPIPRQVFAEVLSVVNTQKPAQPAPDPTKGNPPKTSK